MHVRYLRFLALVAGGALVPIWLANMVLGYRVWANPGTPAAASRWQERTHGVVLVPAQQQAAFKAERLRQRRDVVNAVVFGSSTAMAVTADMFPRRFVAYNAAVDNNETSRVIDQARQAIELIPREMTLLVPLDWSIGFVFGLTDLPPLKADMSLADRARDAMTLPRVRDLVEFTARAISKTVDRSGDSGADGAYICPDGTPAADFDSHDAGRCAGFHFDGSATFVTQARLTPAREAQLLALATAPDSSYAQHLVVSGGVPHQALLDALADVGRQASRRGGRLIVFLPPLAPGFERAFAAEPSIQSVYRKAKSALEGWAAANNLSFVDAGASEEFGCQAGEFVDIHHALPDCYRRVMAALWRQVGLEL
jgi:hypothetical protein